MRFQDHVVIVTGAARGLGRRYAERFADEGAEVEIMTSEALRKMVVADLAKWAKVAKDAGMKAD